MRRSSPVYAHEISGLNLALYTAEEIRKLSVLEITNECTIDTFGTPSPRGLYDPALGPFGREE